MSEIVCNSRMYKCFYISSVNSLDRAATGLRIAKIKEWREAFRPIWSNMDSIPDEKFPVSFIFGGVIAEDVGKQKLIDTDGVAFLAKRCLDAAVLEGIIPNDSVSFIEHVIFSPLLRAPISGPHNYVLGGAFVKDLNDIPQFRVTDEDLKGV